MKILLEGIEAFFVWNNIVACFWLGYFLSFHGSPWGAIAIVLSFMMVGLWVHSNLYVRTSPVHLSRPMTSTATILVE
jgi:hypothetical protein